MQAETIRIVALYASCLLAVGAAGCLIVGLVTRRMSPSDKDAWDFLYYGGLFSMCAAVSLPYPPGGATTPRLVAKYAVLLVGLGVMLWTRKKRSGYKGPTPLTGTRGAMMIFPLPVLFMLPIRCVQWWSQFGGGMGFLLGGGLTLDPVMAIGGMLTIIGAGDYPAGC